MPPSAARAKLSGPSGNDTGSRSSGPAMTESSSAASRTVRAIGPTHEKLVQPLALGNRDTRPSVGLSPTTPQQAAGWRMEPARSLPSASGPSPAASAAAAPPLDPPGVRPRFHGLR